MRKILKLLIMYIILSSIFYTTSFATQGNTITFTCVFSKCSTKAIKIKAASSVHVNWGDSIEEDKTVGEDGYLILEHEYASRGNYSVSIVAGDLTEFETNFKDNEDAEISTINLSSAPSLEKLIINDNQLTTINLSSNTSLKYLNCNNNNITSLTLPNSLEEIYVNNNVLSELNLSNFIKLVTLECSDNNIGSLLLTGCSSLEVLKINNNNLSTISLSTNTALRELYCRSNEFSGENGLDLSNNTNLEKLDCTYNELSELILGSQNTSLGEIYAFGDESLSEIDLNNLSNINLCMFDSGIDILNNNSNCVLKVEITGNNGIEVLESKMLLIPDGATVKLDDIVINVEDNILDVSEYIGVKNLKVIFNEENEKSIINIPQILDGMIPVKYNGTNWVISNSEDDEWYDYDTQKWANVMLRDGVKYIGVDGVTLVDVSNKSLDSLIGREIPISNTGSMYVWIPRYSYKINNSDGSISIKYSQGIIDDTTGGYIAHPAFNYASYLGNDNYSFLDESDKCSGIWVAKYPAGQSGDNPKYAANLTEIKSYNLENAFQKAKLVEDDLKYGVENITSHLMKNSEWGAVAYLTTAIGNLENNSTTSNMYGIYGMDNSPEYVSAFIELVGGISNLTVRKNAKTLIPYDMKKYSYESTTDERNIDIIRLKTAVDSSVSNATTFNSYYGFGMTDVSSSISGDVTKNIPYMSNPFLIRGIDGIYSYSNNDGTNSGNIGFRNTILCINSTGEIVDEEYYVINSQCTNGGKINPLGNTTLKAGTSIIYSIMPEAGYEVVDILVDGISAISNSNYIKYSNYSTYKFENLDREHSIYVKFGINIATYNVTVKKYLNGTSTSEAVGTISGDGSHNNSSVVLLNATPNHGYGFDFWTIESGLDENEINISSSYNEFNMPNNNVNLIANFVVTLAQNVQLTVIDGDGVRTDTYCTENDLLQVTADSTCNGKIFTSWTATGITLSAAQINSPSISIVMPNNSVTLVANYIVNIYTVTKETYTNGSPSTTGGTWTGTGTYNAGTTVTISATPNSGYTFTGWEVVSGSASLGNSSSATTTFTINGNVTIRANFLAQTYTITYNANSGSGAPASQTKTHGVNLTLSSTVPTYSGHTFNGWNTAQNGSGTSYTAGGTYSADADATLYAQWELETPVAYTLTLNPGGTTYAKVTNETQQVNAPVATGYTLTYNYNGNGTSNTTSTSTKTFNSWTLVGGGSLTSTTLSSTVYTFGTSNATLTANYTNGSLTLPTPTWEMHKLKGWYTASTGGTKVGNGGASYTPTMNKTLYAQWEEIDIATIAIGSYVSYIPSTTSYTVATTASGHTSNQTFTPNTYSSGWKVFKNNSGQLDIISAESIGSLTLKGAVGYAKAVNTLNNLSSAYVNSTYATSGRSLGSSNSSIGEIDTAIYPLTYGVSGLPYIDTYYTSDETIINNNPTLNHSSGRVWLASRELFANCMFFVRDFKSSGVTSSDWLYCVDSDGSIASFDGSNGVRPVISLKSGLRLTGGSGTQADPYTVSN